jgi:DtxR family Mn-dependent transcriptional regulator
VTGRRHAVLSIESTSVQDYVKAIYTATEWQDDAVTATRLAGRLDVANSSVTGMVVKLVDLGLAEHRKYGPIGLTPSGRALALAMVRRHRLIETFLVTELGYGWEEVHDEAERLEHTVSDAFVERLDARLDHPPRDPHGDPIPTADGTVRYPPAHRLDALDDGHSGPVVRVSDEDPGVLRLLDRHGISLDDDLLVGRLSPGTFRIRRVDWDGVPAASWLELTEPVPSALWIGVGTGHTGCVLPDGAPITDPDS